MSSKKKTPMEKLTENFRKFSKSQDGKSVSKSGFTKNLKQVLKKQAPKGDQKPGDSKDDN